MEGLDLDSQNDWPCGDVNSLAILRWHSIQARSKQSSTRRGFLYANYIGNNIIETLPLNVLHKSQQRFPRQQLRNMSLDLCGKKQNILIIEV